MAVVVVWGQSGWYFPGLIRDADNMGKNGPRFLPLLPEKE